MTFENPVLNRPILAFLLVATVFLFVASVAIAQETGIRTGAFILRPQIELSENYSDNVFFDETGEKEDYVTILSGQLEIKSDWSRHALDLSISTDITQFIDNSDENTEQYGAGASARLDLKHGTTLTITGSYDRLAERRDNAENVTNITKVDEYRSSATLNHKPNRLGIRLGGGFKRRDFQAAQEEARSRNDYDASTRISYETTPQFSVFAQPFLTIRDFDNKRADGTSQNSVIYGSLFGTELDLRGTLTGEVGVGTFREEFDDNQQDSLSTLALDGSLEWRPTRLTTFTGTLSRRSEATQDASSKVRTSAAVTVQHELKRDLIVRALGDYFREDFESTSRIDNSYRGEVGLTYQIRDRLSVFGDYEYRHRDSDVVGRSFRSHTATLGLRARF